MSRVDDLFNQVAEDATSRAEAVDKRLFGKEERRFGVRGENGRYHMPLLPGEQGTKSGGDWVPYGLQSMTNLVGAFEDTRALSVWEQAMALIGVALSPELHEELVIMVQKAQSDGVVFERLKDFPEFREALAGKPFKEGESVVARAKRAARAGAAAQRGTNRHDAWEHRGRTGELIGTPDIQRQIEETERLLAGAGLMRIPGLSERVVRNTVLNTAGRFDDILLEMHTGRLLMADLKTKKGEFYSMTVIDAQLAGYAHSEYMLPDIPNPNHYVPGPRYLTTPDTAKAGRAGVDLTEGVVLHVPSDGGPAFLRRADLVAGWHNAKLARQVVDARAAGKSVERFAASFWSHNQNGEPTQLL